jgi:formylglycine-generating enzyme required for sulfatase activity
MRAGPAPPGCGCCASSGTTSATVPSATRSSRVSRLGCGCAASKVPRRRSSARSGQQHVEHHADAGQRLAREAGSPAGWG